MDNTVENGLSLPPEISLLKHQIGGHAIGNGKSKTGILKHLNGHILKPLQRPPLGKRESDFYKRICRSETGDDFRLRSFLPKFFDVITLPVNGDAVEFLELADVTEGFSHLCVIDLKMGKRTWDPEATEEKRNKEEAKYKGTRSTVGFCVQGMRVYRVDTKENLVLGREYGKQLNQDSLIQALHLFFNSSSTGTVKVSLVDTFLKQLYPILEYFRHQTQFHFYSSSVLLCYDARMAFPHAFSKSSDSEVPTTNHVNCCLPPEVARVHMIDFAHVFPSDGTLDHNFLDGLEKLIKILESFVHVKV